MDCPGRCMALAGILLAASPGRSRAQLPDQSFEVVPEVPARVTVGDTVTLRFRVRLDERDLLYDTVPKALGLPPGVRVLSVEKLRRGTDRIYGGRARLAFYRPGRQPAPVFGLPFMRGVKGITRGMLTSDSAYVDIAPLAPAGSPALKDIKTLARKRRLSPLLLGSVLIALAGGAWASVGRRRRRPRRASEPEPAVEPTGATEPYRSALARLAEIGMFDETGGTDPAVHYEAVANVLREYLAAAAAVPAPRCTSAELVRCLPPRLSQHGHSGRLKALLEQADLVKFAQAQPHTGAADIFAREARGLLDGWHTALSSG